MNSLILGNLVHRPLRSIISAFVVAIEVVMILSVVGLFLGILNGSRTQTSGIGMDMIVHPGASTAIMSASAAAADTRIAPVLAALPHVQVVSPVNIKMTLDGGVGNINGIDFNSYNALKPFVFVDGRPFQHPYEVLIDDIQAAARPGLKVGDHVKILNHDFTVCGIVEHGKGGRKYIPITTMDAIDSNPNKASAFYLRTDNTPEAQDAVRKEVLTSDGLQDWSVQTIDEFLSSLTPDHIPFFNVALDVVIGIATTIGFLVVFQSMYTAVLERTREIGILKSMGAGHATIVSVVLRETMLLAAVGIALGVAFTFVLRNWLHGRYPTLSFQLTPEWIYKAILIASAGALFGALYPALKAARKDPIDALSYE